jgi:hypothetical protein
VADLLADSEYLGATGRAYALSCRSLVLHDDALGVLDLFLGAALHAVCLHSTRPQVADFRCPVTLLAWNQARNNEGGIR